jgi:hypothetical protein
MSVNSQTMMRDLIREAQKQNRRIQEEIYLKAPMREKLADCCDTLDFIFRQMTYYTALPKRRREDAGV